MMNKALNSFLLMLVGLTFFMLLNILTSANYLYKVVGIRPFAQSYGISQSPRALFQQHATSSPDPMPKPNFLSATVNVTKAATNVTKAATNVTKAATNVTKTATNVTVANGANDKSANVPSNAKPVSATTNAIANKVANDKPKAAQPRPDVCANCFVHNFTYLTQNTSICATSGNEPIDLLILILTIHSHAEHRQNIRKSWASYAKNNTGNVRYAFLLGWTKNEDLMNAVYTESKDYGDILMEDFKDAYSNLTYKTMMAMKWTTLYCPQARYLMKTDDDMWVNVPQLLILLDKRGQELQQAVGGACSLSAGPIRNTRSKWYASKISYPHARYPGFCSGTGYVTSGTVAKKIYEISPNIPFFHLEDVYVALCINKLRMKLLKLPGFHNYRTALKPCEMRSDKVITSHMVPTDFLHKVMEAQC